jgi:antitoxin (DNA-binding transcriptional repressor) of toxin-antitoxin stability system
MAGRVRTFENQLFRLEDDGVLVRITRTAEPVEDLVAFPERVAELGRALEDSTARVALMDLRNGPPGRNDPEFEQASTPWRRLLGSRFGKVAVLVRTQAGRLQVTRLARQDHRDPHVFLDEQEALDYLMSG